MKYSIIIPYRDREEHLINTLPRLNDLFQDEDFEILVVEQDDNKPFNKNGLLNIGALNAKGDILIFHDVDFLPDENVNYHPLSNNPLYCMRRCIFLTSDGELRNQEDIPKGYQNFHIDVGYHVGAVISMTKEMFLEVNGFNHLYRGWGKEDHDIDLRLKYYGYTWDRNEVENGTFFGLYHEDTAPKTPQHQHQENAKILSNFKENLKNGINNLDLQVNRIEETEFETTKIYKIS